MADGVHAAMQRVQPAALEAMADRTTAEPEIHELRTSDDPVLLLRKRRNRPVD